MIHDPETLRFAATLVCGACRAYADPTNEAATEDCVVPSAPPHRVPNSKYRYWHRGLDEQTWHEWPCAAEDIWEYLRQTETL